MRPILFDIAGIKFYSYGAMMALAVLVGSILIARESRRRNEGFEILPTAGLWGVIGGILGAKLVYQIEYEDGRELWRAFMIWQGGMVFYGGLIGGTIGAAAYALFHRIPMLKGFDIAAPYVALAHGIARTGCFLNGCCFGKPCDAPWGVTYPANSGPYLAQLEAGMRTLQDEHAMPIHPTQVYETLSLFIIAAALKWALNRKPFDGAIILLYFTTYATARFAIEYFRGDNLPHIAGMTTAQAVSLLIGVTSASIFMWLAWNRANSKSTTTNHTT